MLRIGLFLSIVFLSITSAIRAFEPAGTRIQGMGGAGAALPSDAATIFWNPAGLYYRDRIASDFTFSFNELEWPKNWGFSYLNYSRTMHRGAGLGVYRIKDETQPEGGDAVAVLLSTVYPTPIHLPLGLSFKYINERWADEGRKSYFTADVGTLLHPGPMFIGVNFQSATQPNSRIFPYRVLLGASLNLGDKIILSGQGAVHNWDEVENLDQADLRAGLEIQLTRAFSAQGGWAERIGEKYWTGGLGVKDNIGRARLYVAYHWHPDESVDDRIYLSYDYFM